MKSSRYRMPAEWEPHEGTWLAWPHKVDHWPGKFEPIPRLYAEIVRALTLSEKVFLCVNDKEMERQAREVLSQAAVPETLVNNIIFFHIPTDASWSRDHGPIFVRDSDGSLIITDWIFNAWGGKYEPWARDDVVPQEIARILNLPMQQPRIVLEGGSIDVNGKGTLLTTEQCLLHPNRNPHLNKEKIEELLLEYLGGSNILWLKEGIVGDDTDGHIDDIARFVNESTVVCAVETNRNDENFHILQRNFEDLKNMKDQDGRPLNIVALPMPDPVYYENQRLPASYANFYIANGAVLVPTFRCKQDAEALAVLRPFFPGRQMVAIDCVDLVWGLGTIHCSTQQHPANLQT